MRITPLNLNLESDYLKSIIPILFLLISYSCCLPNLSGQAPLGKFDVAQLQQDTFAAGKLFQAGDSLSDLGLFEQALEQIQKAKGIYFNYEQWEKGIECLITLSLNADYFQPVVIKMGFADQAIDLSKKHLPPGHPLLAAAFRQKAEAFSITGQIDSINPYLYLALPIFDQQEEWVDLAWCRVLLGLNFLNQSQLDSCDYHFQQVQSILAQKTISEASKSVITSTVLSLKGVQYERQGDYDKAIDVTKQALDIELNLADINTIDSSYISNYYLNLGAFYFIKGDNQRALDNYMQAIYSYKNASTNPTLLNNISELLSRQKKYKEAIEYAEKSLLLTEGNSTQLQAQMNALKSLTLAYRELGQKEKALYYGKRSIELPTNYRKAIALSSMGQSYLNLNQANEAIKHLLMADGIYKKDLAAAVNQSSFFQSRIYRLMAEAHLMNEAPETALAFYQKALIANHETFQDSLNYSRNPSLQGIYEPIYFLEAIQGKAKTLATFKEQPEQLNAALATYQLSIQWIDTLQSSYATENSQLDWSSEFKPIYEEAIALAYQLFQTTKDAKYLNQAFAFSEKSKNAILLETLKSNEGKTHADVPDSLIQKEKDLNLDIAFYHKELQKVTQKKEANKIKLYQQYLSKTRLELTALKDQIEQDFPKFQAWKYGGEAMSISKIQNALIKDQTAFLEYFIGDHYAFVFVITKQTAQLLPLDDVAGINQAIKNFREVLLDISSFKQNAKLAFTNYQQGSRLLFQQILEKPIVHLASDIEHLILVPDGLLNTIPFEAIAKPSTINADLDFAKLAYLLYDYRIQYAYSADLLLKNQHRQNVVPANAKCLAYAPPYQASLGNRLARGTTEPLRNDNGQLEGTATEIKRIADFFDGQFEAGEKATEAQFKEHAAQYGILHLAMHGAVDLDNSDFNHLRFSNLNKDSLEDNILYHYEIANMDLSSQLVVLSACETGVGKYEKGEGVFSLARSFMYAGVPSVVMSLWKVSDASTSQLMPYFYKNLAASSSKDEALHAAKQQFLKDADLEYRHPYYWSAFVILGDAQAIKSDGSTWSWYLFGSMALLFGSWWIFESYFTKKREASKQV